MIDLKLLLPAGAGLLLSFSVPADRIAFAPEKGLAVTRTVENRMTLDLEDFAMYVDGQDMTAMMGGLPEMSMTNRMAVTVSDEFVSLRDGRPGELKRTYERIDNSSIVDVMMAGEGESQETEMESDLEGATVVFAWNEEDGEYAVRYADEDETRDEDLLEGLSEDMDLRAFLPGREVEEGESWDLSFDALLALVMPGGNLKSQPEGMDDMDMGMDMGEIEALMTEMMSDYEDMAEMLLDGERRATYRGMREVDGRRMGVIELELDTDGTVDLSGMIADMMDRLSDVADLPMEFDMTISVADLSLTLEGAGELLFDPERMIVASMTMETDMEVAIEMTMDADMQGQMTTLDMTVEMAGDMENSYRVE